MSAMTMEDGKKVGVPFDNHGWVNYVNTKLVKDAGLDPENMPKNGKDFIPFVTKLTTDESGKHPGDSGFNPDKVKVWGFHQAWIRFTLPSTFYQFGGGIITPDRKKSLLDSAETTAAVQYWYDLMYKYKAVPPAVPGATGDYDLYANNSLGMMWEGTWTLGFFKDHPDLVPNTKAMWLNSLAPDGKQFAKMDIHNFQIPAGVNPDGVKRAQDLIKFMSENSEHWANAGHVPARLSQQAKGTVQSNWETKVAADEFSHIGHPDVTHKAFTEIQAAWEASVGAVLANTQPIKDALTQGSQQIQSILDRG
jgi:multiple sugar transport system substrate-binding protein